MRRGGMGEAGTRAMRVGVAGLGRAFAVMLPTFLADARVRLVAAADPRSEARAAFAADFGGRSYETVAELCADAEVEVVYIATPHQHHRAHAVEAARHGKHLLIEKPMALTLEDCEATIAAARAAGVHTIVGHSHSFDAPVQRLRALVASGDYGRVRMINAINYTDYLYRPRRPEELDTAQGGGAVFNQAAHQVDIVRLLGGGNVVSVRAIAGTWDATRPTEGAYAALLTFADGAFASLSYSGYGRFDSDEFHGWIGEMGQPKPAYIRVPRQRFDRAWEEAAYKNARNYGGSDYRAPPPPIAHQNFGTLIVSCELADLRALPTGVAIYQDGMQRIEPLPPPMAPRGEVIDELYDAVVDGKPPLHDGAWAMATVEVLLGMLRSAREGCDVALSHQVQPA